MAKFVKRYANVHEHDGRRRSSSYGDEVRSRHFPEPDHVYSVEPAELDEFRRYLDQESLASPEGLGVGAAALEPAATDAVAEARERRSWAWPGFGRQPLLEQGVEGQAAESALKPGPVSATSPAPGRRTASGPTQLGGDARLLEVFGGAGEGLGGATVADRGVSPCLSRQRKAPSAIFSADRSAISRTALAAFHRVRREPMYSRPIRARRSS